MCLLIDTCKSLVSRYFSAAACVAPQRLAVSVYCRRSTEVYIHDCHPRQNYLCATFEMLFPNVLFCRRVMCSVGLLLYYLVAVEVGIKVSGYKLFR